MNLNQRWSSRRLRVALLCAALGALWLTACDDTLPPISDGRAPDRGATDRGAADASRDLQPASDAGPAADGGPSRDWLVDQDAGPAVDGPLPKDGCVRPPGGCFSDGNCKPTEVCSTSTGECQADPCCPQCAVCYGKCVPKPQLTAEIIQTKAWRLNSSGTDSIEASADVLYANQLGGAVSKLELVQSTLVSATAASKAAVISFGAPTGSPQTIQPGRSATLSYAAVAAQPVPFGCLEPVQLRTWVSYTVVTTSGGSTGQLGPIVSAPFSFTCQ